MFYLSANENVTGPFTREELLNSIQDGIIPANAQIREEGSNQWQPISVLSQPQPSQYQAQPNTAVVPAVAHPHYQPGYRNPSTAILLELLPGILLQTFGIGNIYAGNVTFGITMMITYWVSILVNVFLMMFLIGFVTWPITFALYLTFCLIYAQKGAERANWRVNMEVSQRYNS